MKLIINHSSMQPIYEQISGQIKDLIIHGELTEGAVLPSVRVLARELRVSALTVKKSYDTLEQEGFVTTVHGKGSFVSSAGQAQFLEEKRREVEAELEAVIRKGRSCGLTVFCCGRPWSCSSRKKLPVPKHSSYFKAAAFAFS